MTADAWRGVAAEKADEVTAGLAALLRERSRRLLGDLLRPHRRAVIATISLIVVESLAALAGPDVLILDDPLSALDVHTEERVTRALHQILAGATALVVAHRPSTVALADTVALLSGGVIAATGSHRELLASNPEYADLMDIQDLEATA